MQCPACCMRDCPKEEAFIEGIAWERLRRSWTRESLCERHRAAYDAIRDIDPAWGNGEGI